MGGDMTVAQGDEVTPADHDVSTAPDAPAGSAPEAADTHEVVTRIEPRGGRGAKLREHRERARRRIVRRVLIGAGVLSLILSLIVGGGIWFLTERWAGNIDRVSGVFDNLDEGARPAPSTPEQGGGHPVTFLLMGSDSGPGPGGRPDGRSDAIMLVRIAADRQHAQLISIPRDSWVDIPGHGNNKINAAYAVGGPSLLIQTVEQLTRVRIDHFAAIDFDGITQVTDDLGGVDVVVEETTSGGPYTFSAGVNHLDGDQARWYLGQRNGLPGGDLDRVQRQQQYLKSTFGKLFTSDTFTDPGRLDAAMLAVTSAVVIDDSLSNTDLLALAYSARNITPSNVDFFTAPVLGTGREGAASVVYLDDVTGERMWESLRRDSLSANAAEFKDQALRDVPR
jgi:LCP family protein required for cell wall assembly